MSFTSWTWTTRMSLPNGWNWVIPRSIPWRTWTVGISLMKTPSASRPPIQDFGAE